MRNISIIKLISFFFILALVVINISFTIEYNRQIKDLNYFTFQRFMMGMRTIGEEPQNKDDLLAELGIKLSDTPKNEIRTNGKKLLEDSYCDMILYHNTLYFVPRDPPPPKKSMVKIMLLAGIAPKSDEEVISMDDRPALENLENFSLNRLWILWGTMNVVTVIFFIIVLRKLLRLRNLKSAIRAFGDQTTFQEIPVDSKDELGEIAAEFNLAMKKIHLLKESRTLFLRNILHELRTPVMKGKILASIIKDDEFKGQLRQIFIRQEVLLGEMVKVEKLASNEWVLSTKEYRLVDILDHAIDLLLMHDTKRICINAEDTTPILMADFELLATAVKNLLDNALKYSKNDVIVDICPDHISICSDGEKIPEQRLDFTRAFNRDIESTSIGLGLGLYIANSIILKHSFDLLYHHENGKNYFRIFFQPISHKPYEEISDVPENLIH